MGADEIKSTWFDLLLWELMKSNQPGSICCYGSKVEAGGLTKQATKNPMVWSCAGSLRKQYEAWLKLSQNPRRGQSGARCSSCQVGWRLSSRWTTRSFSS
jgi:hypothetical protein